MIDLRSDTVTLPTPAMRDVMAKAEVGDDVYGEDPTINRLETLSAEKMGKEAGLFIPSGTMGNLIAFLTHCQRGDEAIMGDQAHTFHYEVGGVAALGGIMVHTVPNQADGTLKIDDIMKAIRGDDIHLPSTRLISLENTQNRCGGVALPQEYTRSVVELAKNHGLKLHMDGARIFNAAVKLGAPAKALVEGFDSVTFCLSKGLGAPVGSVLCGNIGFIEKARKIRKQLGGGMRQAGILAAAGIYALENMIDRLAEDHRRATDLAVRIASIPVIRLRPGSPHTNMIFFDLVDDFPKTSQQVIDELKSSGLLAGTTGLRGFRLVIHNDISDENIHEAAEILQQYFHKT
jgi:threonine aldolase